jgi:hypothetical protein
MLAPNSTTTTDGKLPRQKIGRKEQCPCGSGKKFKKCSGAGQPPKKATSGRLAETLDRIWNRALRRESGAALKAPEIMTGLLKMDNQLFEFWRTREDQGDAAPGGWLAKAKNIMAKRLMGKCCICGVTRGDPALI